MILRSILAAAFGACAVNVWGQSDRNADGCIDMEDFARLQVSWTGPDCLSDDDFVETVLVEGGGGGPEYDFMIGKYEVTNEQFLVFLNDVNSNADLEQSLGPFDIEHFCNTLHASGRPIIIATGLHVGPRFRVAPGYEKHPVITTWDAAAGFCNWLTVRTGLPQSEQCYVRDEVTRQFKPKVISWEEWRVRDLSVAERTALVRDYRGFRIPMDNSSWFVGSGLNIHGPFNEWYKAASMGSSESRCAFGFGRETLGVKDANFKDSYDPFDYAPQYATTPIGFFDGFNLLGNGCQTRDTDNLFGLYDLSGNVAEWVQDRGLELGTFGVRGGSFRSTVAGVGVGERVSVRADEFPPDVGFRVARVP